MAAASGRPAIEQAIKDPSRYFGSPRDVVADRSYSLDERRRILESWALDAELLTVAEEENMGGEDRPGLREVKLALLELQDSA